MIETISILETRGRFQRLYEDERPFIRAMIDDIVFSFGRNAHGSVIIAPGPDESGWFITEETFHSLSGKIDSLVKLAKGDE